MKTQYKIGTILLIFFLFGSILGYTLAQSGNTFIISEGVYSGAPSYTIWRESSLYYAKNAYGLIDYSGTNASLIIQNAIDTNYAGDRGVVFLKADNYVLNNRLLMREQTTLLGEGSGRDDTPLTGKTTILTFSNLDVSEPMLDFEYYQTDFCRVENLVLYGNGTTDTAIKMKDTNWNIFRDLVIEGFINLTSNVYYNHFETISIINGWSIILNGNATGGCNDNTFINIHMNSYPELTGRHEYALDFDEAGGNNFYHLYITAPTPTNNQTVIYLTTNNSERNHFYGIYFDHVGTNKWTFVNCSGNYNLFNIINSESATAVSHEDYGEGNIWIDRGYIQMPKFNSPNIASWGTNEIGREWFDTDYNAMCHWNGTHIIYWNATGVGVIP